MESLSFLEGLANQPIRSVYVLHGEELFLKRLVIKSLRTLVLQDDSEEMGYSSHDGERVSFSTVYNDLATVPFFSARRLVLVEDADTFVSNERKKLEKYLSNPAPTGVLVLSVKTWPSNTTLAKQLTASLITCNPLKNQALPQWSQKWCSGQYHKNLAPDAAQLLVELTGPDMGLLDQEIKKLSIFVGNQDRIAMEDVDRLVGNRRQQVIWSLFDLIGLGKTGEALGLLNRLFEQGEDAPKLFFSAISFQLRRIAQTAQMVRQGLPVPEAMSRAKIPDYPAARRGAEQLLRQIGSQRAEKLFDWLVHVNLDMISSGQLSGRLLLERLIVLLSHPHPPRP